MLIIHGLIGWADGVTTRVKKETGCRVWGVGCGKNRHVRYSNLDLINPEKSDSIVHYPIQLFKAMEISVPDRLDSFIQTQVKLGSYASPDEFVTDVLEQFQTQQLVQPSTPEPPQHPTESLFGCLKGWVTILGDIVEPIEDAGWELLP